VKERNQRSTIGSPVKMKTILFVLSETLVIIAVGEPRTRWMPYLLDMATAEDPFPQKEQDPRIR
jgi:hypothetical protein